MSRNSTVLVQQLLGSGNRTIPYAARKLFPGCNFIQPQTLTSIPSSPPSPIYRPFSSSVYVPSDLDRRLFSLVPIDSLIRLRSFSASYRNEYDSTAEKIRDECLDAVCCFYDQSLHLPLVVQGLVEKFPHVKTYHFLVFNVREDDTYDASMRELHVSRMPAFRFFQNGKKVDELVGGSVLLLDKTIKSIYNTEESLDHKLRKFKDHRGAVEGGERERSPLSQ